MPFSGASREPLRNPFGEAGAEAAKVPPHVDGEGGIDGGSLANVRAACKEDVSVPSAWRWELASERVVRRRRERYTASPTVTPILEDLAGDRDTGIYMGLKYLWPTTTAAVFMHA